MPVVPTEQNKVGIAGVTGAKLEAGDFSGSGLQAIGSGLQQVSGALGQLEKAQEAEDDAAIKQAYNHYAETVRPFVYEGNDALAEKQGAAAVAMAPIAIQRVHDAAEAATAGLKPRLQGAFRATMAPRIDQDIRWIAQHHDTATRVSQSQQSDQIIGNCKLDAINQHGTFAYPETVATGIRQIGEQVAAGAVTPEAGEAARRMYLSGINLGVITRLATSDPVLGAGILRQQGDTMTPDHHQEATQALQGPLDQARGIGDVDSLIFARSPIAPETPPGDIATTGQRMLAITPQDADPADPAAGDAGTVDSAPQPGPGAQAGAPPSGSGDLRALLQHYGGDAAKAWAASRLGGDAVDALVATHGGTWFGALPDETRKAVANDMGLLRAAISSRAAPAPADRAALARQIDAQPWREDRKRNAHDELHTRNGLADRRLTEAQKGAADRSFKLSDSLGPKFTSINQIPPADRLTLDDDTRAALVLRADRNVHPVTVPAHGDVAMDLNRMAATDPEAFAKQDLRLVRDRVTPAEYDALGRVQQAWSGYPPGAAAVNQQRALERARASGLDVGQTNGSPVSTQTVPDAVSEIPLQGPGPSLEPEEQDLGDWHASEGTTNQGPATPIEARALNYFRGDRQPTLIQANYSRSGTETASDEIPAWLKKQRRSIWRSPIYFSSSDEDVYHAVRRMGNPDGWTIIYTHGAINQDGKVYDTSRGSPHLLMTAPKIFNQLRNLPDYDPKATILLTACYSANDTTARDLSALTHGVVYAAKGYVSEPSVQKGIYRLSVNNQYGETTGYAKFVNGEEVPSELLALRYDINTHSWKATTLTKPAPVGDRSPSPGKEPLLWRMTHPGQ